MDEQRFAPPLAVVADIADTKEVPAAILKKIRTAWVAGLFSAGVTLAFTLWALSGSRIAGISGSSLLDVVLILALTFGIYRKSRVCAVAMLAYFVVSKYLMFKQGGQFSGVGLSLAFLYCYAQGVFGTFQYHKHLKG